MEIVSNPEDLPLAERFRGAEFLRRELSEHLRQSFLPRLSALRTSSKELDVKEVSDQAIYDKVTATVQSEEFAADLSAKLIRYLESIEGETRRLMRIRLS